MNPEPCSDGDPTEPHHGAEGAQPAPSPDTPAAREDAVGKPRLSKEDQMAAYEEYLKENDWGHQPC